MYDNAELKVCKPEYVWIPQTLNAWYHIQYRIRKLIFSLAAIPPPNTFLTRLETNEEVCRVLQLSPGDPGYAQGGLNYVPDKESWFHVCLFMVCLDVAEAEMETW